MQLIYKETIEMRKIAKLKLQETYVKTLDEAGPAFNNFCFVLFCFIVVYVDIVSVH